MRFFKASVLAAGLAMLGCGEVTGAGSDADEGNPAEGPAITAISPERGGLPGGQTLEITGSGFIEGTRVVIGTREATVVVESDTSLSVETPPGDNAGETVDVLVFNDNGSGMMPASFTYNEPPTVAGLSPRIGRMTGGTTVTVTGTGFMVNNPGTPAVTVGGIAATNVTVVDDETLTFDTGAADAADAVVKQDVEVRTGNGTVTLTRMFAYVPPGLIVGNRHREGNFEDTFDYVDPATGATVGLGGVDVYPFGVSRMGYGPSGELFVVTNRNGIGHSILKVDLKNGEWEFVGIVREGTSRRRTRGAAFNGNTLYVINDSNVVGTASTADGTWTTLGGASVLTSGRAGCIIRRDAASLWYAAGLAGPLSIISVADGSIVPGGPTMNNSNSNYCHGATFVNNTLHIVVEHRVDNCCGNAVLATVNTGTGAVAELHTLPRGAAGLVETPPDL